MSTCKCYPSTDTVTIAGCSGGGGSGGGGVIGTFSGAGVIGVATAFAGTLGRLGELEGRTGRPWYLGGGQEGGTGTFGCLATWVTFGGG